jgi:hypothetical protein
MGKDQAARLLPLVNSELFDRFVEFIEDEYQRSGTRLDSAVEVRDIRNLQGRRELLRYLSRLRDHVNDASRR